MSSNSVPEQSTVLGPDDPQPLSLRLPLVVMFAYWCLYFGVDLFGVHMFPKFLIRLGSILLCGLILMIWWFRAKRFSLKARWSIVGLSILGGVVATLLLHHTVLPPAAYLWSLPVLLSLGVVWLAVARNAATDVQFLGLCAVIVLAWLPGPLVRMEGLNGDGSNDVYWRWSASSEDRFLENLPKSAAEQAVDESPLELSNADWPLFRGPQGNSKVPGLTIATDWEKSSPKLLWKQPIGPAWSSTIIVGDRLFTQEQRGEIDVISCYSAETGKQLWVHETKDRFEEALGGVGPRATPTFADGKIYAYSARGRLDCLDARTGKPVWSVDAFKDKQGRMPMWGYSVSPVVVDGLVIVFVGGETTQALAAYDAASGSPVWTTKAGVESYTSPIELEILGAKQVLYLGDSQLVSVEPKSGKILWTYDSAASHGRPCCQPQLVGEDRLLLSFGPNDLEQIKLGRKDDAWSAERVWTTRGIKPDYSDYLEHKGHIYGFDGTIFCCVDLQSGERKWKKGRYGAGQALLLPDMDAILVCTEQGELVLVECNPEQLVELAKLQAIKGKTWNHQSISRGRLFVRNAEEIACYELPVQAAKE